MTSSSSKRRVSPKLYYLTTTFGLFVRIKEASFKYFGRSLAECEHGFERLEDSSANFSDIGSDISEVGKQLIQLKVRQKPPRNKPIFCLLVHGFAVQKLCYLQPQFER